MGDVEEWRAVEGYPEYDVSNIGQVRRRTTGRILRPSIVSGYYKVNLYNDGRISNKAIHQLVARAFIGEADGRCVDHRDRSKLNNNINNLRYVSNAENQRNKTSNKGHVYEFIETLPVGAIEFPAYCSHRFENYFYNDGVFYYFTGIEYRIIPLLTNARNGMIYIYAYDTTNTQRTINVARFRRMINDLP